MPYFFLNVTIGIDKEGREGGILTVSVIKCWYKLLSLARKLIEIMGSVKDLSVNTDSAWQFHPQC